MDPVIMRALERIIAVIIGGMSIYLGYRLFAHLPWRQDSAGEFKLPGGISIYLSRVGPGVFFALFGAAVVALSLYRAVTFTESAATTSGVEPNAPAITQEMGSTFVGVGPGGVGPGGQQLENLRLLLKRDITVLNSISADLDAGLDPAREADIQLALSRTKLTLMARIWDEEVWGEYSQFEDWFRRGEPDPPPPGLEAAVGFYRSGQEVGAQ